MARVEEIKWTDLIHSPRSLVAGYQDQLPVYILVTKGFCGQNDIETISSNQMARVDSIAEQMRVLVEDTKGQYFSLPEDFAIKFDVKEKRKIKQKTLKDIVKRYKLPVPIAPDPKVKWHINVTDKRFSSTSLGALLVIAAYKEKFMRLNTIHDGIIDSRVSLLPLYLDIGLRVAEGIKGSNKNKWRDTVSMYNRAVKHTNYSRLKGPSDILVFSDEDLKMYFPAAQYELMMANKRKKEAETNKTSASSKQRNDINGNSRKTTSKHNGQMANGHAAANTVSSTQTDDDRSDLTVEGTGLGYKKSIIKVNGRSNDRSTQPASPRRSRPVRILDSVQTDGYFTDSEMHHGSRLTRTRIHSSTGDLWANRSGPATRANVPMQQKARMNRLRSSSMSRLERVHSHGTRFMPGGQRRDYGFEDRPTTIHRYTMHGHRSEPMTPDSVFSDSSDGYRNATIIKLRGKSSSSWGYGTPDVHIPVVDLSLQPVIRTNSMNYDNYRSKASPTVSIPLGGSHDINIATLTRPKESTIYVNTRDDVNYQHSGAVLSQGLPVIEPAKDEELLHIEIQGADKEWTLKHQKPQKSPSQQSAVSSVYVGKNSEPSYVARSDSLKHGTRLEGSGILSTNTDGPYYMASDNDNNLYRGKVTIPNLGFQQHRTKPNTQAPRPVNDEDIITPTPANPAHAQARSIPIEEDWISLDGVRQLNAESNLHNRDYQDTAQESNLPNRDYRDAAQEPNLHTRDYRDVAREPNLHNRDYTDNHEVARRREEPSEVPSNYNGPQKRRREIVTTTVANRERNVPRQENIYENGVERFNADPYFGHPEPIGYHDLMQSREEYTTVNLNNKRSQKQPKEVKINRVTKTEKRVQRHERDSNDPTIYTHIRENVERVPIQHPDTSLMAYKNAMNYNMSSSTNSSHDYSISPPVGSSHISKHFNYEPVERRYNNRNHYYTQEGWNLLPAGSGYRYGPSSRSAPLAEVQEVLDPQLSPGLEKFPDYVSDAQPTRDIHISYNDSVTGSQVSRTLTPTDDVTSQQKYNDDDDETEDVNPFNLHTSNKGYEGKIGEHVQVINMDDGLNTRSAKAELQQQESSEVFTFNDSSGTACDTSISSLLESSKFEAMRELDKMTGSGKGSMVDLTDAGQTNIVIGSRVLKQDDNNNVVNMTQVGSAAHADASEDSDDGASSASSDVAAGSYEFAEGIASMESELSEPIISVKTNNDELHQTSKHHASNCKELSSSSFTMRSSTTERTRTVAEAKPAAATNTSPGDVTYQSAEGYQNPGNTIRAAVVRANSKGPADQRVEVQDELREVLRMRSVSLDERDESQKDLATHVVGAQSNHGQSVQSTVHSRSRVTEMPSSGTASSKVGTALRIERGDLDNERSQRNQGQSTRTITTSNTSYVASGKTNAQSKAGQHVTSQSRTTKRSTVNNSGKKEEATTDQLIHSGSLSSLRQVYKTPPSSLREKSTISVVKGSEIFDNAPNTTQTQSAKTNVGKSDKSSYGGAFLMRFKEGAGSNSSGTQGKSYRVETQTTRQSSTTSGSAIVPPSAFRDSKNTEVVQDMSLPASEEVHIQHMNGIHDLDEYLKAQSDDTISQSSYSSSKLEHFNFGLATDLNTQF